MTLGLKQRNGKDRVVDIVNTIPSTAATVCT